MRRLSFVAAFLVAAIAPARAQQPVNWDALQRETVQILSDYLKINTANPPGNELDGALFLKRILEKEGFEVQLLDTAEFRGRRGASLYTRLKGNGSKKAIALVNHIDVVPADNRYWSVDPYSGVIKDGFIYGRGALQRDRKSVV